MDLERKLKKFIGERVSVLIDTSKCCVNRKSYGGILKEVGEDYIVIDASKSQWDIQDIILTRELILSVWTYKKNVCNKCLMCERKSHS